MRWEQQTERPTPPRSSQGTARSMSALSRHSSGRCLGVPVPYLGCAPVSKTCAKYQESLRSYFLGLGMLTSFSI